MFDFGVLPPEINSGRMYVGPGSGPLLAAAAAWDALAVELQSTAASYGSTIETLTVGPWTGPSSIAMAAAATPYVAWIQATGAQAEEAATQASLAAGSYEAAFAATVPPPVIAANRALLMALIATNIFGQNTPAIAATEAQYMEMWAQDAAAMYAYAGSSASASQLTSFTEPPQTTSGSGLPSGCGFADQHRLEYRRAVVSADVVGAGDAAKPGDERHLADGGVGACYRASTCAIAAGLTTDLANWNSINSSLTSYGRLSSGTSSLGGGPFLSFGQTYAYAQNAQGVDAFYAPKAISGALAPLPGEMPHLSSASVGGGPVSGSMGRAALVGSMSVPQGWTEAAPAIRTLASVLPTNVAAAPVASLAGGRRLRPDGAVQPGGTRDGRFGDVLGRRQCRRDVAGRRRRGRPGRGHNHRDPSIRGSCDDWHDGNLAGKGHPSMHDQARGIERCFMQRFRRSSTRAGCKRVGVGFVAGRRGVLGGLATEIQSTTSAYSAVIEGLISGPWVGPSSVAMAAAVAPYLSWMQTTAATGRRSGAQATAAASAYETAFAAHVPPVEIAANRSQLASLGGDQHFGQNNPGDRRHRNRIRGNVGSGRHRDGQLRQFVGGRPT